MASFGDNLRREREMRNVSLEEISAATKIGVRFLSAIEKEEFDKLPGGIFNRGFVRAFASYLGLDEEKIVAEYLLAAGEVEAPVTGAGAHEEVGRRYVRPVFLTLVVLSVAAGLAYNWYVRHLTQAPAAPTHVIPSPTPAPASVAPQPAALPPDSPVPASQSTATEAADSAPKNQPVQAVTQTRPAAPAASPSSTATDSAPRLRLQIDVLEPSWVSVTADGHRLFSRTLQSRETLNVTAAQTIRLTTGNASAVVLTLNGETLAPLGKPGEVRSITLTEKDLKTSSP